MIELDNIYKQYASNVFKYLMCLCHNSDLSEELTQETFYQAVKSIHNYNGSCKMSVWLCQIAKHSYYKYLENNKKHKKNHSTDLPHDLVILDTPESDFIKQKEKISIYHSIHSIDEPYKEILLLRLLGDLTFREIGEILGKSENWARVTFYRAKIKLRERIDDNEC